MVKVIKSTDPVTPPPDPAPGLALLTALAQIVGEFPALRETIAALEETFGAFAEQLGNNDRGYEDLMHDVWFHEDPLVRMSVAIELTNRLNALEQSTWGDLNYGPQPIIERLRRFERRLESVEGEMDALGEIEALRLSENPATTPKSKRRNTEGA